MQVDRQKHEGTGGKASLSCINNNDDKYLDEIISRVHLSVLVHLFFFF